MLIGSAVQQGAARGLCVTPVFSNYSFHGPVFRLAWARAHPCCCFAWQPLHAQALPQ